MGKKFISKINCSSEKDPLQKISLYALFTHRQERGKVIFLF
jgi:hypothetical protein